VSNAISASRKTGSADLVLQEIRADASAALFGCAGSISPDPFPADADVGPVDYSTSNS
jgi:hypothetical protein